VPYSSNTFLSLRCRLKDHPVLPFNITFARALIGQCFIVIVVVLSIPVIPPGSFICSHAHSCRLKNNFSMVIADHPIC
jgi:hypothetical protein